MKRLLLEPLRLGALAVAAAVVTGACVSPNEPGVSISPLNADIVFGVGDLGEEEAAPAGLGPDAIDEIVAGDTGDDLLPPQTFAPAKKRNIPRVPFESTGPPPNECPPAALNEFPDEEAPKNVDVLPREGVYKWQRAGTVAKDGTSVTIDGLEERSLQKLQQESADPTNAKRIRFGYELVQPVQGSDELLSVLYRVDSAARSSDVESGVSGDRVTTGEPERGLVIKRMTYLGADGKPIAGKGFSPTTGLLIAPLPIREGEHFTSVAVDPGTQQTYRYEADVLARDSVDACGTLINGWRIKGTLSVSGETGGEYTQEYIVAPHYGMIPLLEHTEGTSAAGAAINVTYTIGSERPY